MAMIDEMLDKAWTRRARLFSILTWAGSTDTAGISISLKRVV